MPELPEVQTIVDGLNQKIKGYTIVDFWTEWPKTIKMPLASFKKEIIGRKIIKAERRAKNILIYLSGKKIMLVHLKMTGHLLVKDEKAKVKNKYFEEKVNGYIRHSWFLKKGKQELKLDFSDLRKFGRVELFNESDLKNHETLSKLGIEPLSKEFTLENFTIALSGKRKSALHSALMDQNKIAGIGNIYASEVPFEAGVRPNRKVSSLKSEELKALHKEVIKVLQKAIKHRGTSDSDYRDVDGAPGDFQKLLKVYGQQGRACKRKNCKGEIVRQKIGQRSAFWCSKCQK
ncbi:MAG TPA: bifunctional DNA-formamidopyrimidine glycosylase/DNA-(apurinic or apyrimidinic site) lyase [Candidatus Moranbacteria bacterium]|nr:bifunctional DNA-formamidopyrimidine glycosylase/DNA-(apurinic or apyrimidinic site) lyase [Candidatus Moranbacteria bacterium]